jgi:hypothetical protein
VQLGRHKITKVVLVLADWWLTNLLLVSFVQTLQLKRRGDVILEIAVLTVMLLLL